MANDKPRTSGIKRRFCDIIAGDTAPESGRPYKRMSPFHNTPIQKKETKRRILKISMKKMKGIDCPETFLRRSVLINNLARSLQADLKDDKIWDRWGWECDLDTFPCRSPQQQHPMVHKPTGFDHPEESSSMCTLLTNAMTSSSASSQWTLSTHANWMAGDDDEHLSPSERERVTRDLAQSHDKLAQTVERLAFDSDVHFDAVHTTSAPDSVTDKQYVINCYANRCALGNPSASLIVPDVCSYDVAPETRFPDTASHQRDINKNQTTCAVYNCTSPKTKPCAKSNTQHFTPSILPPHCSPRSNNLTLLTSSGGSATCSPGRDSHPAPHCQFPGLSTDIKSTACSQASKSHAIDSHSPCNANMADSTTCSYLDMSLGFYRDPPVTLIGRSDLPDTCHVHGQLVTSSTHVYSHPQNVSTVSSDNHVYGSISVKDSPELTSLAASTSHDVSSESDVWNIDSNRDVSQSPSGLTSATSAPGSCSAEADISDRIPPFGADQDSFSSHNLRDFDVIYNNLVSVLIGGN